MKIFILLLLLFSTFLPCYANPSSSKPSEQIYIFLKQSLPKNSSIVFLNVTLDNKKLIESTQKLILKDNYFFILDRKNLSKLAKQSMLQDEPHFLNSKSHKFIPSDWGIFISGKTKSTNLILKKIKTFDYTIKIDSIKNGTTKEIYHLQLKQRKAPSLKYLELTLLIITILLIYIHFLTKGYYRFFILFGWIVINFLIFYFYFFI